MLHNVQAFVSCNVCLDNNKLASPQVTSVDETYSPANFLKQPKVVVPEPTQFPNSSTQQPKSYKPNTSSNKRTYTDEEFKEVNGFDKELLQELLKRFKFKDATDCFNALNNTMKIVAWQYCLERGRHADPNKMEIEAYQCLRCEKVITKDNFQAADDIIQTVIAYERCPENPNKSVRYEDDIDVQPKAVVRPSNTKANSRNTIKKEGVNTDTIVKIGVGILLLGGVILMIILSRRKEEK